MHPFESSAPQIFPHDEFVRKVIFTQTDASFFLSLPMACVWASMRGRCLGLGSDDNRSSKSTSDASAEPKKEAVFRYIASSCFECFPAIK